MIKRWFLRATLCGLGLCASALALASPMDEESKEIFARLTRQYADSIVRVSFVMKSSFQGQEQSQASSTIGVVVDERGLILVPSMVVEPTFPGIDKLTAEQRASFKLESRDFRIRFAGQDTPIEAEALTSDAYLGVAWLRIKPNEPADGEAAAKPAKYAAVDLAQRAEAAPGQAYYVVERLEDRFAGAPIVSWGVIVGAVSVPRPSMIVTGAIGLGFSAEGKVLGYAFGDFDSMDSEAVMSGQATPRMIMAPAARLASATERAASLMDERD